MSRFYISKLLALGDCAEPSEVLFSKSLNIIYGPSNTGKTYIINCIDFMLGGETPPFSPEYSGYDTIVMRLDKSDGSGHIIVERKILDENKGENFVSVTSSLPEIETKTYSTTKSEYSDLLLSLFGIREGHRIIADKNYGTERVSLRSLLHLFFIREDRIFTDKPVFDSPEYGKACASLMRLMFLFTGNDFSALIPNESKQEREKKSYKNAGVLEYLEGKLDELSSINESMKDDSGYPSQEEISTEEELIRVNSQIDEMLREMEVTNNRIEEATTNSRSLLEQVYERSSKLEELRLLQNRYKALRSQYTSDLKRLRFIIDGASKKNAYPAPPQCPFCHNEIKEENIDRPTFLNASKAELDRIELQIKDLNLAEQDLKEEISVINNEIEDLNKENDSVVELINSELKPHIEELRTCIDSFRRTVMLKQNVAAMESMVAQLLKDKEEYEQKKANEGKQEFDPKNSFDMKLWNDITDHFREMVISCEYPNANTVEIDLNTRDAAVNGKKKRNEGKGFRAFLNTLMLFNLMKCLNEFGRYAFHLLVLDSPILSLKEKKYSIDESDRTTVGMRTALFRYFMRNCEDSQVIIAENEIPENVDYANNGVNLIEFTYDENRGRFGFLQSKQDR